MGAPQHSFSEADGSQDEMTAKQEDQGTMNFGTWVQTIREKREMDIRAFAHTVRVHASTISRIEQARSQVTLWTAVRICEGVEATPADLLAALQGKRPAWATGNQRGRAAEVITINDLEALLFFQETLVQLRVDFLLELTPLDCNQKEALLEATRAYLAEKMPKGDFLAWIA